MLKSHQRGDCTERCRQMIPRGVKKGAIRWSALSPNPGLSVLPFGRPGDSASFELIPRALCRTSDRPSFRCCVALWRPFGCRTVCHPRDPIQAVATANQTAVRRGGLYHTSVNSSSRSRSTRTPQPAIHPKIPPRAWTLTAARAFDVPAYHPVPT
jgi:hypothetical protein